jgi:REP element-mobilizing transposase RayT
MTYARKTLISLQDTPYYHVVARCVRRAWLWGVDDYAGRDYSHRKAWVLERLTQQSSLFAIDVCAYAIMSNHYHLVLYVDRARSRHWSQEEVVARWTALFNAPPLVARWQNGLAGQAEREAAAIIIEGWRARLSDISWYMKCLNEHLARRANAEDNCTGRFWEGRFRSQALLDEAGLLTAMTYVDLNPIRAGIAATPEASEFTSVHQRIRELSIDRAAETPDDHEAAPTLRRFKSLHQQTQTLPCTLKDYLRLVDWTGRAVRSDKRGFIADEKPSIIQRLNIDPDAWQLAMQPNANVFGRALGRLNHLRLHASTLGQSWVRGLRHAERIYSR